MLLTDDGHIVVAVGVIFDQFGFIRWGLVTKDVPRGNVSQVDGAAIRYVTGSTTL